VVCSPPATAAERMATAFAATHVSDLGPLTADAAHDEQRIAGMAGPGDDDRRFCGAGLVGPALFTARIRRCPVRTRCR
jgi:hypothetical protein